MIQGTQVRLTKISATSSSNSGLRTTEVEGLVYQSPVIGSTFILLGKSLDPKKNWRHVETSRIESIVINEDGIWYMKTLNSEYKLEKII